jgi:hypothetical protein
MNPNAALLLLAGVRARITQVLMTDLRAAEACARASDPIELGPVEDSLRAAFREVSRVRQEVDPRVSRAPNADEWRCPDCDAKLAGIAGLTISIIRPNANVRVDVPLTARVEVVCPRCKRRHAHEP